MFPRWGIGLPNEAPSDAQRVTPNAHTPTLDALRAAASDDLTQVVRDLRGAVTSLVEIDQERAIIEKAVLATIQIGTVANPTLLRDLHGRVYNRLWVATTQTMFIQINGFSITSMTLTPGWNPINLPEQTMLWATTTFPAILATSHLPLDAAPSSATGLVFNVQNYGAVGDDVTDDTAAIQAAINAAQTAGGGRVFLPPLTYKVTNTLFISADNIELVGSGWASRLHASGTNPLFLQVNTPPGGAGNFRYGIRIADVYFDGNHLSMNGLNLLCCYGAVVEHIRMRYVNGVNVHWNGAAGQFGAYNYMLNCHISDGGTTGVGVQTDNSEWLTIEGCHFGAFTGGTAIAALIQNLNNKIIGTSFDLNDTAVHIKFTHRNIVSGCQFDRGVTQFIRIQSGASNIITGNSFNTSNGGASIINVDDTNTDLNVIIGNAVKSASGWTNFLNENANTGGTNLVIGNDFSGLAVVRQNAVLRGNHGYNPVGKLTSQPAVPATTVAQTNDRGSDVTVYVAGGTVSAIAIGGNATGLTSGAFRVAALQTITLTYTVAPTWVWFGD